MSKSWRDMYNKWIFWNISKINPNFSELYIFYCLSFGSRPLLTSKPSVAFRIASKTLWYNNDTVRVICNLDYLGRSTEVVVLKVLPVAYNYYVVWVILWLKHISSFIVVSWQQWWDSEGLSVDDVVRKVSCYTLFSLWRDSTYNYGSRAL